MSSIDILIGKLAIKSWTSYLKKLNFKFTKLNSIHTALKKIYMSQGKRCKIIIELTLLWPCSVPLLLISCVKFRHLWWEKGFPPSHSGGLGGVNLLCQASAKSPQIVLNFKLWYKGSKMQQNAAKYSNYTLRVWSFWSLIFVGVSFLAVCCADFPC